MNTETRDRNRLMGLCVLLIGVCPLLALAYPPDNAAVLYYKTCLEYQKPEADVKEALNDVATGAATPGPAVRDYVAGLADKIKTLTDAGQIQDCDWGYDYSRGFDMVMAPLADMRSLARIMLADAHIHLEDGDWRTAMKRCSTVYGMARHIKADSVLICHLIGIAMEEMTNQFLTKMLGQTPLEASDLEQIKHLLDRAAQDRPGMKSCLTQEVRLVMRYTSASALQGVINASVGPEERIPNLDQQSFTEAMAYYQQQMQRLTEAFDLEYGQAVATMDQLEKKIQADARRDPKAKVASALVPAVRKCLSVETRGRTQLNALRAALAVYLAKAHQGRLPQRLPDGLPGDLFSGQDFAYQGTDAGFTLRCQGRDADKDKMHSYEFGVPK